MNNSQIAQQIKETEEKLASLRLELEKPEYPTLANSKPGDKLENGCIVVHKFSDVKMALIAAPQATQRYRNWSKEFSDVFDALQQEGFIISQWFIPTTEQLQLAYKNCKEHFSPTCYWSRAEASSTTSHCVNFFNGARQQYYKDAARGARAFSLVSY